MFENDNAINGSLKSNVTPQKLLRQRENNFRVDHEYTLLHSQLALNKSSNDMKIIHLEQIH